MCALLQQAFAQLVRKEYALETRYAVCANVLSNYVFSDTAHGARDLNTNYVLLTAPSSLFYVWLSKTDWCELGALATLAADFLGAWWDRGYGPTVFFAEGVSRTSAPSGFRGTIR